MHDFDEPRDEGRPILTLIRRFVFRELSKEPMDLGYYWLAAEYTADHFAPYWEEVRIVC